MQVTTDVDSAPFREALTPAFAEWEKALDATLLRRIRDWQPN
jgi:hypothetical protein